MYQKFHVITNVIKENIINLIKVFTGCSFIGKIDGVTVVVGDQCSPECEAYDMLVEGFSVCDEPGDQCLSNLMVHVTHAQDI